MKEEASCMNTQLTIFLLLFGGVQGFLFSFFLVRKRLYANGYLFLLLYLGVLLLQITLKVMSKLWLMENWNTLYLTSHALPLLYGPLAFLFVKYFFVQKGFERRDSVHFLPITIYLFVASLENRGLAPDWLDGVVFNPHFRLATLITSIAIYHVFALRVWKRNNSVHNPSSFEKKAQKGWLLQFIWLSAIMAVLISLALYLLYLTYPAAQEYRFGFIVLTLFIYWLSYKALSQPVVFSVIYGPREINPLQTEAPIPAFRVYHPPVKYSNSGLSEERVKEIAASLEQLMKKERIYLDPELSIDKLAEKLSVSRHHLSQVLNDHQQKSYYDYINSFRVAEAATLLISPQREKQKIAAIAYDAGFNSLSAFNDVFKKHTGKTPSEYRKEKLNHLQKQRV